VSTPAGANLARELHELGSADELSFGGKSASLGELLGAGVRVPPGFALSCEAHALARASGGMPAVVRDEISRRYATLAAVAGELEPPVAVRSSAVGEDSATATFAGQQETILWMRGVDEICGAVSACWDSLYSDTAVSYREHLGGDDREPAMGVAIQLMVDAAVAGVLFTCNPLNGDPSVVAINASWGLGLAVVGGEVTPDDHLVSKVTGEVVRETVSVKGVEYVPDPAARGVVLREVPPDRASSRCLDDDALDRLLDVARAAERHFGSHQDVEWAIARTGTLPENLFVLQSRPVTTVGPREPPAIVEPVSGLGLVMRQFGAVRGGSNGAE
jgi:pyruvate,water dikinase